MYDETVLYNLTYLTTPTPDPCTLPVPPSRISSTAFSVKEIVSTSATLPGAAGIIPGTSSFSSPSEKLYAGGILPLEFLLSKHKQEWNNLAERALFIPEKATLPPYKPQFMSKVADGGLWIGRFTAGQTHAQSNTRSNTTTGVGVGLSEALSSCPQDLTPRAWAYYCWLVDIGANNYIVCMKMTRY